MQKQTHRPQRGPSFKDRLLNAYATLKSKSGDYKKRQEAFKTLTSRVTVIWPASRGILVKRKHGPQGKAAKKALRKATHIPGYYGKVRRGEIQISS